jgi:hypothetical protein
VNIVGTSTNDWVIRLISKLHLLKNLKFQHRHHKRSLMGTILSQLNQVHIYFDIILQFKSSKWYLPIRKTNQISVFVSLLHATRQIHRTLHRFAILTTQRDLYK